MTADSPPRPTPPGLLAQQITFLYAADPAASRRFYGTVLGLRLVLDQGACAIFEVAGQRAFIGVCQAVPEPGEPPAAADPRRQGGVVLTLVSDAVEAWHAHLLAAGVRLEAPPASRADIGITHLFFRDPAGYLLEIQHFEGPAWHMPPAP